MCARYTRRSDDDHNLASRLQASARTVWDENFHSRSDALSVGYPYALRSRSYRDSRNDLNAACDYFDRHRLRREETHHGSPRGRSWAAASATSEPGGRSASADAWTEVSGHSVLSTASARAYDREYKYRGAAAMAARPRAASAQPGRTPRGLPESLRMTPLAAAHIDDYFGKTSMTVAAARAGPGIAVSAASSGSQRLPRRYDSSSSDSDSEGSYEIRRSRRYAHSHASASVSSFTSQSSSQSAISDRATKGSSSIPFAPEPPGGADDESATDSYFMHFPPWPSNAPGSPTGKDDADDKDSSRYPYTKWTESQASAAAAAYPPGPAKEAEAPKTTGKTTNDFKADVLREMRKKDEKQDRGRSRSREAGRPYRTRGESLRRDGSPIPPYRRSTNRDNAAVNAAAAAVEGLPTAEDYREAERRNPPAGRASFHAAGRHRQRRTPLSSIVWQDRRDFEGVLARRPIRGIRRDPWGAEADDLRRRALRNNSRHNRHSSIGSSASVLIDADITDYSSTDDGGSHVDVGVRRGHNSTGDTFVDVGVHDVRHGGRRRAVDVDVDVRDNRRRARTPRRDPHDSDSSASVRTDRRTGDGTMRGGDGGSSLTDVAVDVRHRRGNRPYCDCGCMELEIHIDSDEIEPLLRAHGRPFLRHRNGNLEFDNRDLRDILLRQHRRRRRGSGDNDDDDLEDNGARRRRPWGPRGGPGGEGYHFVPRRGRSPAPRRRSGDEPRSRPPSPLPIRRPGGPPGGLPPRGVSLSPPRSRFDARLDRDRLGLVPIRRRARSLSPIRFRTGGSHRPFSPDLERASVRRARSLSRERQERERRRTDYARKDEKDARRRFRSLSQDRQDRDKRHAEDQRKDANEALRRHRSSSREREDRDKRNAEHKRKEGERLFKERKERELRELGAAEALRDYGKETARRRSESRERRDSRERQEKEDAVRRLTEKIEAREAAAERARQNEIIRNRPVVDAQSIISQRSDRESAHDDRASRSPGRGAEKTREQRLQDARDRLEGDRLRREASLERKSATSAREPAQHAVTEAPRATSVPLRSALRSPSLARRSSSTREARPATTTFASGSDHLQSLNERAREARGREQAALARLRALEQRHQQVKEEKESMARRMAAKQEQAARSSSVTPARDAGSRHSSPRGTVRTHSTWDHPAGHGSPPPYDAPDGKVRADDAWRVERQQQLRELKETKKDSPKR